MLSLQYLDKIHENTLHFKVAYLYLGDNTGNCSLATLNFSFLALELTVGLSFFSKRLVAVHLFLADC